MKAEHINPFIKSSQSIFFEVVGVPIMVSGTSLKTHPLSTKAVVIMLGITGDLRGNVAINVDESVAKKIASNMMGGLPVEEFDEISKSAVSELGNMIMGRVCTEFSSKNILIDITPPTLLTGQNIQLVFPKLPLLTVKFKYEDIEVELDLSVHPK